MLDLGGTDLQPAWLLHGGAGERCHVGDRARRRNAPGRAPSHHRRAAPERMDRDGADASIMYGPTDPMPIADAELRRRCYEAYNDWLAEFCAAKPERLIGVAQLSMEDPQAARDELERLAKRGGLRHVNILASRANPPVYDEAWETFWALAEEVGIPIGFHLAVLVKKNTA